jgi:hypothetical protein
MRTAVAVSATPRPPVPRASASTRGRAVAFVIQSVTSDMRSTQKTVPANASRIVEGAGAHRATRACVNAWTSEAGDEDGMKPLRGKSMPALSCRGGDE